MIHDSGRLLHCTYVREKAREISPAYINAIYTRNGNFQYPKIQYFPAKKPSYSDYDLITISGCHAVRHSPNSMGTNVCEPCSMGTNVREPCSMGTNVREPAY